MADTPTYLTKEGLATLRALCEGADCIPVGMVRLLLHDRDEWVERAGWAHA